MSEPAGNGVKPRVLLCECAGTMAENIDFERLEGGVRGRGRGGAGAGLV